MVTRPETPALRSGSVARMSSRVDVEMPPGVSLPPGEDELPYDDGEPMESPQHREQMCLLIEQLDVHWPDRDFAVLGNQAVYYSELQAKQNDFKAPDFFVVLDVARRNRKSWVVWGEDGRTPDVVVEILSESTAANDKGAKKRIYERVLKVSNYYYHDIWTGEVRGFALRDGAYVDLEPDAHGRLPVPALGLTLVVRPGVHPTTRHEAHWLRFATEDGDVLPVAAEVASAMQAERDAVQAERDAVQAERDAAQAERDRLAAELASYRQRFGDLPD